MAALRETAPPTIGDIADAIALFAPDLGGREHETLAIAYLDQRNRLLAHKVYRGVERARVEFPVREVVVDALLLGAHGIVLAHDHPGGDPAPSADDLGLTRALATIFAPMGITILDHLIAGGGRWASFRGLGLV